MLVSVVIPTYNRANTITRAVDSVLSQTWKAIEVIVVDDGSTDETPKVLAKYGDKIRFLRRANGGPSAARNTGIKAATGEIIAFLDSDDEWLPSKIEKQALLLQRTASAGVVCCVCNSQMVFSSKSLTSFEISRLKPGRSEGIWTNPAEILIDRFLLFNQAAAIRREALVEAGHFREDLPFGLNDDYDLALRLSLVGPWAFIADPLVIWHEHQSNISRTHNRLAVCTQTLKILDDIANSPRFSPRLPQPMFRNRQKSLRRNISALTLQKQVSPGSRFLGFALGLSLRGRRAFQMRWPFGARMQTLAV